MQSIISQLPVTTSLQCLALASNARAVQYVLSQTKIVKQAVKVGQRVDHNISLQASNMQMQQKMLKIPLKGQKYIVECNRKELPQHPQEWQLSSIGMI